ncbi:hypothetical protein JQ554_23305 [Bradyrhizobium diazoefficiens]|nr:hypothetical protein [Bradyrhizobium diazoefficiens]MBR0966981.1 hypothetical protein [Bradyrhizobium diazoefficiens]MBR0979105.1 hypothetical protein [Bradyrhizobium diazoefficiens]MBR1009964.1 hypothetical protein [Bradyrhizobium diazoefficiens]MBR1015731.1 hypothetical protein [Bradyrhizobium diazoefficiens]MBR1053802.1 hypothetical protein [Bradyrhizobium diazoefficiens]
MKDFTGANNHNEDELQRVAEFMRSSAYLDKRQQQILESEQVIIGLQRSIRNVTMNIAQLLVATPSAGNQTMLERSLGELAGLANAVSQTAAAAPSGGDSGASRGSGVDLNGIQAAIETHSNSSNGTALQDGRDKSRMKAERAKELPSLDGAPGAEADPNAPTTSGATPPGDAKPNSDTPASNLDRINKLAEAASRAQDDPAASVSADTPALPNKPGSRSNLAALKLDHADVVAKPDAPDQHRTQSIEAKGQATSTPVKAEPTAVAAAHRPPSPGSI